MAKKVENIRKRKDGRWESSFKEGSPFNGRAKYTFVYEKAYTKVNKNFINARNLSYEQHKPVTTNPCFKSVLLQWINSNRVRLKGATESKYQYIIERHLVPTLGAYKIHELTSEVVNKFLEQKLKHGKLNGEGALSPSYVKGMAVIISSAIKFAVDNGMCTPVKISIYKPAGAKKDLQILSFAEQKRLEALIMSNIDQTKTGILLALHAGLRIGEICALTWNDVDFSNSLISVRHTISRVRSPEDNQKTCLVLDSPKTAASRREIPITSVLLVALKLLKQSSDSTFVVSTDDQFVSTRTFDYRYRKALKTLGFPVVNFHTLRHTFATTCVEVGVDVKTLSELLGHSSVNITLNTYVHSSVELKRKQLEKICFATS